jgi:hypothetical protein
LDPLIKSQLLYQLSYAPGVPAFAMYAGADPLAKRRWGVQPRAYAKSRTAQKKKPPGGPGGFSNGGAQRSGRAACPPPAKELTAVAGRAQVHTGRGGASRRVRATPGTRASDRPAARRGERAW